MPNFSYRASSIEREFKDLKMNLHDCLMYDLVPSQKLIDSFFRFGVKLEKFCSPIRLGLLEVHEAKERDAKPASRPNTLSGQETTPQDGHGLPVRPNGVLKESNLRTPHRLLSDPRTAQAQTSIDTVLPAGRTHNSAPCQEFSWLRRRLTSLPPWRLVIPATLLGAAVGIAIRQRGHLSQEDRAEFLDSS